MRGGTSTEKFIYWLLADRIPLTKLLIIINIFTFLVFALVRVRAVEVGLLMLMFDPQAAIGRPWTFFTYPLVAQGFGVISMLFAGYWLWVAGGSLERSWGTRTFGIYFFGMSAITALSLFVGYIITSYPISLAGLWLPIAGVTVAFAMLNPEQQILFFFIIPLKLKYLALLDVVLVLISYSQGSILMGIFALAGCAVSYWYVRRGRYVDYPRSNRRQRGGEVIRLYEKPSLRKRLCPVERYRKYREQKRLKDFLDR